MSSHVKMKGHCADPCDINTQLKRVVEKATSARNTDRSTCIYLAAEGSKCQTCSIYFVTAIGREQVSISLRYKWTKVTLSPAKQLLISPYNLSFRQSGHLEVAGNFPNLERHQIGHHCLPILAIKFATAILWRNLEMH